jgi:mannosyl-oligosaccharide alpha-1,3-glucosidase
MLARDNHSRRPFVLTRSYFMGSQKYGTFWTGDNNSLSGEIQGSINMLLENAVSGFAFGGSDIPGFFGFPSDELYIRFY